MLNLLSKYVGSENWNSFTQKHQKVRVKNKFLKPGIVIVVLIGFIIFLSTSLIETTNEFSFCFVDAIKNEAILKTRLDIEVLQKNESPLYFKTDSLGCFHYESKEDKITFVVKSPYHKTDTITRTVSFHNKSIVRVQTDDYSLMLEYYANGNVKDWKKHKVQLYKIIADDAQIHRLFGNDIGIEVYSKEDFIRLSTTPTSILKRIKILDKRMRDGKITNLKFIVI